MHHGPLDEDLKTWRSHDNVAPAGGLQGVELGSRWRHQVRLPEHGKESEGEAHPQGRTEGPQAGSDDAEVMEQCGKDGKTSDKMKGDLEWGGGGVPLSARRKESLCL